MSGESREQLIRSINQMADDLRDRMRVCPTDELPAGDVTRELADILLSRAVLIIGKGVNYPELAGAIEAVDQVRNLRVWKVREMPAILNFVANRLEVHKEDA